MFSSGNKTTKVFRVIIDIFNVLIGISVVVLAVFTFFNPKENAWMFPLIFMLGGLMNCITGIKHILCDKKVQGIVLQVIAVVLFGITYFTYVAIN